ncbi:MAG: DUF4388 domain-containing protein [Polyangiaceae bacterium]|nr:DUF4388 domain-containing protein [Polyangiaceae bacterium]
MKDVRDELVRIDSQGGAHPIGTLASQRLRFREGTFRMLPGPKHVVFMRYTGEDGQRDDEDGAIVRLGGELTAPGSMCDILALLAQSGWRGELTVSDALEGAERSIFFDQGNIVGVATNVKEERLGAVIYHFGGLTLPQLQAIEARVEGGRRFGEAAVELGFLEPEAVYQYIGKQVREVVFATLMVADGTFFFLDGFDDALVSSRHTASANSILMDGVTRLDELKYFRQKVPSHLHVPKPTSLMAQGPDEFATVYAAIDGARNVEEIGRQTGLGEFETTRQIYALMQSKHVEVIPPPVSGGPTAIVARANNAISVVFYALAEAQRVPELANALASFANGAGMYDILFRGAGPDERGQLDPDQVAENALLLSGGAAPDAVLAQMFQEYVSFALFSAGALLGPAVEQQLRVRVYEILTV